MPSSLKRYACLAIIAFVFLAGCVDGPGGFNGESGDGRGFADGGIAEYASEHYIVRVAGYSRGDRGQEIARHSALMMEKMFNVYSGMEEIPLPPGDPMPFWLYFNRREYDRQAALYEFPANTTNGFCTTSGEVYVYYRESGEVPPEATAMHEGFHQYCHRALHHPTPPEVFQRVPGYKMGKLPTVPLWLAEGMAMSMESGRLERDHNGIVVSIDDVGSVNKERLAKLASLINSGRCPSVRGIMNKIMGDQISTDDYAAMWGIVFDLRMATGNAIFLLEQEELEAAGPEAVRAAIDAAIDPRQPYPHMRWPVPIVGRFLRACRVVWGLDVQALVDACADGAREPKDFDRQWNRRLTQAALAEVEKLLHDRGETLEQWERNWKKRMQALHREVRSGRYQYIEPAGVKQMQARRSRAIGAW